MSNYITLLVLLLEKTGAITHADAKKLGEKLLTATLPANYEAMERMIIDLFKELEIKIVDK